MQTTTKQQFKAAFRSARSGSGAFGFDFAYPVMAAANRTYAMRNYRDPLTATTSAHRLEQKRELRAIFG